MPEPRTITPEKPHSNACCVAPGGDVGDQGRGQVLVDPARTEIVGVQAGARGSLVEHHQLFAMLEAPQRRGQGPHVHGLGGDVQDVRQDPADLAEQHPDDLAAPGHVDIDQPLDGQAEGMLLVHRRHVIEAVEIGNVLEVGARLHQLLGAAMEQADVRVDPFDDLAVQLQHQAQHAVGGRVLGPEVDVELADRGLGQGVFRRICGLLGRSHGQGGFVIVGHHFFSPVGAGSAFSSPGRTYLLPCPGT
jgi:hypothetical protein